MPRRLSISAGFLVLPPLAALLAVSLDVPLARVGASLLQAHRLLPDFLATTLRVTLTTLGAWAAAILLARAMHGRPVLSALTEPLAQFARHVSPFAWFPFAIIWFGLGETPAVFVLAVTLFFPALISARSAIGEFPEVYREEARVAGADDRFILLHVEAPMLAGPLLGLLRVLWGLGWTAGIAVEMLGVRNGLGFRLMDYRYLQQYNNMIALLLWMGAVGLLVDALLQRVERVVSDKM